MRCTYVGFFISVRFCFSNEMFVGASQFLVRSIRSKVLRPTLILDINGMGQRAELKVERLTKTEMGLQGRQQKSWKLFYQLILVNKKKFQNNLT